MTTVAQPGGSCPGTGCITTTYDRSGLPTKVDYGDTTPDVTSIAYNKNGRRKSLTDATGPRTWAWDSLGRLTSSTVAGDTVSYGWDLAGNRTTITYPGSLTVTNAYDDAGRWTSVTDWLGNVTTFDYDDSSNLTEIAFPTATGLVDTIAYDDTDAVVQIAMARAGTNWATIGYTRNAEANVATMAPAGLPGDAESYGYDDLDRIETVTTGAGAVTYDFDGADNLNRIGGLRQGFDAANQLCYTAATTGTCASPPLGATTYGHDARGNRTSTTAPSGNSTYAFDLANRLRTATTPAGTTSYTYGFDGLRATKVQGPATTRFVWDQSEGIPSLLSETSPAGTTRWVYGPGGRPLTQVNPDGSLYWYHHDNLGSTRALTDATGTVVGTYSYGAWGEVTGHTGVSTALTYAGEHTDAETGLVYLRARYYDPATGQFMSQDPLAASTKSPYGYANGDPLNMADPLGLSPFCDGASLAACRIKDLTDTSLRNIAFCLDPDAMSPFDVSSNYESVGWLEQVSDSQLIAVPGPSVHPLPWAGIGIDLAKGGRQNIRPTGEQPEYENSTKGQKAKGKRKNSGGDGRGTQKKKPKHKK